jgi:hypothetical protein
MRSRRLWLCVAPVLLCLVDGTITLAGQPERYWAGDYGYAAEGNPLFYRLLAQHPAAFAVGVLGWAAAFTLFLLVVPRRVALAAGIAISLGHTWGIATWLYMSGPHGYWWITVLFALTGVLVAATWEKGAGTDVRSPGMATLPGWENAVASAPPPVPASPAEVAAPTGSTGEDAEPAGPGAAANLPWITDVRTETETGG